VVTDALWTARQRGKAQGLVTRSDGVSMAVLRLESNHFGRGNLDATFPAGPS
jgi:hypothetical protein